MTSNDNKRKRVLITGFGPFGKFNPNPSWEAVEAMETKNMKNDQKIELFKEKIAVRYVYVDLNVPKLLDIKKPHLTIHVGVSEKVTRLRLEKKARKIGYTQNDNDYHTPALGKNPSHPSHQSHGSDCLEIETSFDVEAIRNEFNKNRSKDDLEVEISDADAGGFLCEYIYYTSLSHASRQEPGTWTNRVLFVHVPPNKNPEQLARGLERIVVLCLKQKTRVVNTRTSRVY